MARQEAGVIMVAEGLARREELRTGLVGTPRTVEPQMHFFVVEFGVPPGELPRVVLSGTYLGTVVLLDETQVRMQLDGEPDGKVTLLPRFLGLDNSQANTRLAVDNLDN